MNILFCGDRGIENGVLIAALSLMKHVAEPLQVFILTFSYQTPKREFLPVTAKYAKGLEKILRSGNPASSVQLFDLSTEFAAAPPTANLNTRFTPCCMLRLYADLIPDLPDKILYLDSDVVAAGDPTDFYHTNIDDYELAGVLDNYGGNLYQRNLKGTHKEYLNSGVLLLNFAKIRETKLLERARALCATKKMFMPDQSALNHLCQHKLILDRRFNEQAKTRPDTIFRHFTTTLSLLPYPHPQTIKPWHISAVHDILKEYSFDDILADYQLKIKDIQDE